MNRLLSTVLSAGLTLSLLATPALAQQQPGQHDDQHGPMAQQHGAMGPSQRPMAPEQHAMAPQHAQNVRPPMQPQHAARAWRHGDRYTGSRSVVDWRSHHLRQPPHGYEWVQSGNQFVLIAITSGIIASVLANALNN
jgi:Ni/Co efflux regulator RcnB